MVQAEVWYRLRCGTVHSFAILVNRIAHGSIAQFGITTILQQKTLQGTPLHDRNCKRLDLWFHTAVT